MSEERGEKRLNVIEAGSREEATPPQDWPVSIGGSPCSCLSESKSAFITKVCFSAKKQSVLWMNLGKADLGLKSCGRVWTGPLEKSIANTDQVLSCNNLLLEESASCIQQCWMFDSRSEV